MPYLPGMTLIYANPDNHVEKRAGLSPLLRKSLFELPREEWQRHPGFGGEAQFWTQIHEGLLSASATLSAWSAQLLEANEAGALQALMPQIHGLGRQLIHHAHQHHHIEDDHFFPAFLETWPQLKNPLDLLDNDHKVLAEVLDSLELAVAGINLSPQASERQKRDLWLGGADKLHLAAKRLDILFIRHIGDEEEICIPAMLQG